MKKTARENSIRKHFGLVSGTEVFYSRKGVPGPDGKKLSGWFCCIGGVTRYLGKSSATSVYGAIDSKPVLPL